MAVQAIFDRVKWPKGTLSATDATEDHHILGETTDTFLSDINNGCGGVCAVGAIMADLGATMVDFSDIVPKLNLYGRWCIPEQKKTDFQQFVISLRRYGVSIAQDFFRGYLRTTDWYETAISRGWDGDQYYRFREIEAWNDEKVTTEQDVNNFLGVLDTYPPYKRLALLLSETDSDDLRELHEQALRLDPNFDSQFNYERVKVFNQIFDLAIHED